MLQGCTNARAVRQLGQLLHAELDALEPASVDETHLRRGQPTCAHGPNLFVLVVDGSDGDVMADGILDALPVLKLGDSRIQVDE